MTSKDLAELMGKLRRIQAKPAVSLNAQQQSKNTELTSEEAAFVAQLIAAMQRIVVK